MRALSKGLRAAAWALGFAACRYPSLPSPGGAPDGPTSDASAIDAPGDAGTGRIMSCAALPATCGASGNDDCCNSPEVPGGSYYRSYDVSGAGGAGTTSYPATVSGFRLDKYEVTVGRFRAFVSAGMGTQLSPPNAGSGAHPGIAGSGWDASWNAGLASDTAALRGAVKCDAMLETWTDAPAANENRPMTCLTWYEAMAFCAWDGGYLPTEAEWNYAAAGGDEQRAYPWSSPPGSLTVNGSRASYSDATGCIGDGMSSCAVTDLVEVGSKPLGNTRWGHSDLAGNVWEWTLDWYAGYANPCADCADLTPTSARVMRGGGFANSASNLRTGFRLNVEPFSRNDNVGVRCARRP